MLSTLNHLSHNLSPGGIGSVNTAATWMVVLLAVMYLGPATYSLIYIWKENRRDDRAKVRSLPELTPLKKQQERQRKVA